MTDNQKILALWREAPVKVTGQIVLALVATAIALWLMGSFLAAIHTAGPYEAEDCQYPTMCR